MLKKTVLQVESTDGVQLSVTMWPASRGRGGRGGDEEFEWLAVLVHQYSIMGGCQSLMRGIALCLNDLNLSCVTFDMRGVGQSSGSPSITGAPEVSDVVTVCRWAAEKFNAKILLVGSSAGAPIAGSALDKVEEIAAYVGVGYVFGFWASIIFGRHFRHVLNSTKPKLFIMGTKDGFTSKKQLEERVKECKGTLNNVHFVDGIGHFELESFHYDEILARLIWGFLQECITS